MGNFFRRLFTQLGMTGLVIILAALVFGILIGSAVTHGLEAKPAASQSEQQSESSNTKDQGQQQGQKTPHGHERPAPHPTKVPIAQDND